VQVYVAGSEQEHKDLAAQYGGTYVECENQPLGRKASTMVERAWKDGADYVISVGPDDFFSPALLEEYRRAIDDGVTYAGCRGCYMIEPLTRRGMLMTGHANRLRWGETIGAGRLLSRRVLDAVEGRPWPDPVKQGMDWRMTLRLQRVGITGIDRGFAMTPESFLVDVKSDGNMWSFNHVARHTHVTQSADYDAILTALPEEPLIRALEGHKCEACGQMIAA